MKNPFKPFNGESILLAIGISFVSSLILPVIEEMVTSRKKQRNNVFNLNNQKTKDIIFNKNEI